MAWKSLHECNKNNVQSSDEQQLSNVRKGGIEEQEEKEESGILVLLAHVHGDNSTSW